MITPAQNCELLRPWKLATLTIGLASLLWGASYYQISDWDAGISLLMAGFTYLTAPATIRTLKTRNWQRLPHALFWTWFTVDGVYVVYHVSVGNVMLRSAQWPTSLCLYLLCGLIWLHDGPLANLLQPKQ